MKTSIDSLTKELRVFAKERDWEQFHSPKNLSMALVVEVSEILEIFQWLTPEESNEIKGEKLAKVKEEIGDVMIYLTRLADCLSISPLEAAFEKLENNKNKYPIEKSRGNAKKYTEFDR
jgi:dCTP diphosphatase